MKTSSAGTASEPLSTLQKLHRASCLVETVKEVCLQSDNPCEGETLAAAAELIESAADDIRAAERTRP